jgi:hypothetical protein
MLYKILLIPIDDRPVSYSLPAKIASINDNVRVYLPPRNICGGLEERADSEELFAYIDKTMSENEIDSVVISLDTLIYGGLVQSRRTTESFEEIKLRIEKLRELLARHKKENQISVYAFSSVMRISNNNINEEEKQYWQDYGELIFRYSYLAHKKDNNASLVKKQIPPEILQDYESSRQRNFEINKEYLDFLKNGLIDYLIYSQDDTAEFGFNVEEAEILKEKIIENNLAKKAEVQTGADEIPCSLLVKSYLNNCGCAVKIYPVFSDENGKNIISRYENRTIYESAIGQIKMSGAKVAADTEEADMVLIVHTPKGAQNDHAMNLHREEINIDGTKKISELLKTINKPYIIADVAYANGADANFVREAVLPNLDSEYMYSYAGWNTSGNTLGSSLAIGIMHFISKKNRGGGKKEFKKILFIRLLDDWAYQSEVRQKIRNLTNKADINLLKEFLKPYILDLAKKLRVDENKINLSFPWDRTFEVEIELN